MHRAHVHPYILASLEPIHPQTKKVCLDLSTCPDYRTISNAALAEVRAAYNASKNKPNYNPATSPPDPTTFSHILVVLPLLPGCDSSRAPIGQGELRGRFTWVKGDYWSRLEVPAHEMHHNMGLHHASRYGREYGGCVQLETLCCLQLLAAGWNVCA